MYAMTGRLHRSNCKRLQNANGFVRSEAQPAGDLSAHDVHLLALATCCKPNPAAQALLVQEALEAEQSDREVYAAEAAAAADDGCPACGAPEGGTHGCTLQERSQATGYVPNERGRTSAVARQEGLDAKVATGTHSRVRGAKSGDPRQDRGLAVGEALVAHAEQQATEQRCTGTCGQVLPLVKFPTVSRKSGPGRGTECRTCRDERREARTA